MDGLQNPFGIPPSQAVQEVQTSSTIKSNYINIETRPTAFRRNHGVTMRGVKLIYDPTFYLAFDLKTDERLEDPSFRAWLTGGEQDSLYATGSNFSMAANTSAGRCKESLNGVEREHGFFDNTRSRKSEGLEPREGSQLDATVMSCGLSHDQPRNTIPRNQFGQRVDPPIDFDKDLRTKMQKERWCSNHHLKGSCPIKDCRFRHGTLDDNGKNALLSLARGNYCRNGNGCEEGDCYAGHQCPYDPCNKEETCHFPPEMHVTDKQIVDMEVPTLPDTVWWRSDEERRQRKGKSW